MAWLRIQQSLPSHRKILQLADILEIHPAQAMGHMTAFWLWALDSTPHGGLEGISPRMIARSALWDGIPDEFFNALLKVRFLEQEGGEIRIRNWEVYAGPLVKSREDGRKRAIQQREREKAKREAEADDLKIINEKFNDSTHTVREPYANSTQTVCPREEKRREEKRREEETETDQKQDHPFSPSKTAEKVAFPVLFKELQDTWNNIMPSRGKPAVKSITEQRKPKIRRLWKDTPDADFRLIESWKSFFEYCAQSEFLLSGTWFTFDWVINPTNFQKIIEGNYHAPAGGKGKRWERN